MCSQVDSFTPENGAIHAAFPSHSYRKCKIVPPSDVTAKPINCQSPDCFIRSPIKRYFKKVYARAARAMPQAVFPLENFGARGRNILLYLLTFSGGRGILMTSRTGAEHISPAAINFRVFWRVKAWKVRTCPHLATAKSIKNWFAAGCLGSPTGIDFLQDKLSFLRNIQIFKKNSMKYCGKYILSDLMCSIPVRLRIFKSSKRKSGPPGGGPLFASCVVM